MIDVHCHVLPAVDDGCSEFGSAYKTLRDAVEEGISDVILTPHFIKDKYINDKDTLLMHYETFKRRIESELPLKLYYGNELYVDKDLPLNLKENRCCTLNNGRYLLLEFPMRQREYYDYYDSCANELLKMGYKVIVCHPERYDFDDLFNIIDKWLDKGCILQLNQDSLFNKFKDNAIRLLNEDKISLIASDSHVRLKRYVTMIDAFKMVEELYGHDRVELLCNINPRNILENREI